MKLGISVMKILAPMAILAIAAAALATPEIGKKKTAVINKASEVSAYKIKPGQKEILQDMMRVLKATDSLRVFTITGFNKAEDLADPSNSMNVEFKYAKNDTAVYYRLGDNEMIHLPGGEISIQHDFRKILVFPGRQANRGFKTPLTLDLKQLEKEEYDISKTQVNGLTEIKLARENHISCREYSLQYDSAGLMKSLFMRMSDLSDPTDTGRDKLLHVQVQQWRKGYAETGLFDISRYVHRENGTLVPAGHLKDYEIIFAQ
ncbi:hypothetical protein MKQ68_10825 [Chitinophaga horti]|uniref:Outer membrane lipoprotein-sorting protein n=1 Tax=Chitinophaga horti TaxID=2920382 RepID=A0ABY6JBA3_9BACT|nr:hypothetical protein [Chitinophaga horti]UYQ95594.1 hypothetical protein MKQ68_10825 [Chitinophaga horti]